MSINKYKNKNKVLLSVCLLLWSTQAWSAGYKSNIECMKDIKDSPYLSDQVKMQIEEDCIKKAMLKKKGFKAGARKTLEDLARK